MEDFVYNDYDYEENGEIEYADYYEDDAFEQPDPSWEDNQEKTELPPPMSFDELYRYCVLPTFGDSYRHLISILSWSLMFLLSSRIIKLPPFVVHLSSTLFGGALIWQMFEQKTNLMAGLFAITYGNLLSSHYILKKFRGPSCFIVGVVYLAVCELWMVDPMWWHAIRGIQMVILMKIVSIGYDLDSEELKSLPNLFEITGYAINPGSVIFGPWMSFKAYKEVLTPMKWGFKWLLTLLLKVMASGIFLIVSTCLVNWIIPDNSNKWLLAYRDALSFRSSHYFVSYLSEVSASLSGLEIQSVSKPYHIELPRSLVEVVIYWNMPMHHWLKTYVFKPCRIKLGAFLAILFTYGISALFHGLNFQLGAVLLSLGVYTYTEHVLRKKLADIFDACILSRACTSCDHKTKGSSLFCRAINILFGLIAMFHLAYLGMMFDSSNQMEERGYSMIHTLKKWSVLNYASHWLTLFLYILMSVL